MWLRRQGGWLVIWARGALGCVAEVRVVIVLSRWARGCVPEAVVLLCRRDEHTVLWSRRACGCAVHVRAWLCP